MAAGVDLSTVSRMYGIPYGTLARWAHTEQWLVVRPLNRTLGLRQLYDYHSVATAVEARQKRDSAKVAA